MSDFKAKMHQIRFPLGWGSLQRSLRPLAVFNRPTSKANEGEGNGAKWGGEGKGKGRARKKCEAWGPQGS